MLSVWWPNVCQPLKLKSVHSLSCLYLGLSANDTYINALLFRCIKQAVQKKAHRSASQSCFTIITQANDEISFFLPALNSSVFCCVYWPEIHIHCLQCLRYIRLIFVNISVYHVKKIYLSINNINKSWEMYFSSKKVGSV